MTALIREAYSALSKEDHIIPANPHSVQGVATAWAEFDRVPPEEIYQAATWSTPCSFGCQYWLDLAAKSPNFAALLLTGHYRGQPQ